MKFSVQILFVGFVFSVSLSFTAALIKLNKPAEVESSARIVNGYEVEITDVPYQVSLKRRVSAGWVHRCGAVILNNRAILTAAHCVEDYISDASSVTAVVGTNSRASGGVMYDISRVFIHELYNESTMVNDIAFLGTAREISFSPSVRPISFAPFDFNLSDGTEALVSGFGTISFEGPSSPVLLAARVQIVNQDSCFRAYIGMANITSEMICAGAADPARDACQGDSGGPLVANNHLVGIVSWGEGCAHDVYPGVYTRVSIYSDWIEEKILLAYN